MLVTIVTRSFIIGSPGDLDKNYPLLKNELLKSGIASSVTKTASPLSSGISDTWGIEWQGKDPNDKTDFDRYSEDEGLVKTGGLKLMRAAIWTL